MDADPERQRDISPLPSPCGVRRSSTHACLSVRRRRTRAHKEDQLLSELVAVLSLMGEPPGAAPPAFTSQAQAEVMDRLRCSVRAFGSPGPQADGARALAELCAAGNVYTSERVDVAAYNEGQMSWPSAGSIAVPAESVLGGGATRDVV